jgi:hypothetical protein
MDLYLANSLWEYRFDWWRHVHVMAISTCIARKLLQKKFQGLLCGL